MNNNKQVIASATETEITTDIVSDLLPPDQFFRFNPRMADMPIDEVRKERLDWLKTLADEYFEVCLPVCTRGIACAKKSMRPPPKRPMLSTARVSAARVGV